MNKHPFNPELFFWKLIPSLISLIFFVLYAVPKHLPGMNYVMPLLQLMPVFYWGRLQFSQISYPLVFLLGLLTDSLLGTPFGLSALLYLIFLAALRSHGKYIHKESFAVVWGYFSLLTGSVITLEWLSMSITSGRFYSPYPSFIEWLLTIFFYPLFHKLFDVLKEYIKQRYIISGHISRH